MLKEVEINSHVGDILDLAPKFEGPFNLIYLSNIWEYWNWKQMDQYFDMQMELKLAKNGYMLAYAFEPVPSQFKENGYETKQLPCWKSLIIRRQQ